MSSSQLAQVLKAETRPFHDSAEGSQFQKYLTSGEISLTEYVNYLGQLYLVHKSLETAITKTADKESRLKKVVTEEQLQEKYLTSDLLHFNVQPNTVHPYRATDNFLKEIEDIALHDPLALIGIHYVLFGSKHGGKFIAKNLSQVHKLNSAGTKYFDPYGNDFMPYWRSFIEHMNELELSPAEIEPIVQAAKQTFVAVREIGQDLEKQGATL
jgi:heme oxygenase